MALPTEPGRTPVRSVVPREDEAPPTEAEIAAHLAERLVGYKVPDDIRIADALPMTGAQKLDRIALRREARASTDES